jgi:putative nucleotidyltransferase with HDIG domain
VIAAVSCYYDEPHIWSHPEKEVFQTFTWQAAAALENARLYEAQVERAHELETLHHNLEEAYIQMVLSLARAMDARDAYTGDHSERLAALVDGVAKALDLPEGEAKDIRWAAILHDIGKIGSPDHILRKPGPLTDHEWTVMRRHPAVGEQILLPVERMRGVAKIVRHHQEKWDGTGYPDGLRGEAIPLGARILAVVDAYSAIIDERPYKTPKTPMEAESEIRGCAGTHFDPRIVEVFCQTLQRTPGCGPALRST